MRTWCSVPCLAAILAASAAPGWAEPSGAKTASGLLLGLCGDECETLWITAIDGTWQVAARGRGIVVPRRSGFWRVGLTPPADEANWFRWLLWARPAEDRRLTVRDTAWEASDVEDLRHFGGVREASLTFVGPDHVATNETFEAHGPQIAYNQNVAVVPLDPLARPSGTDQLWSGEPIEKVLGPEASHAFAFAARKSLEESEAEGDREMYDESFLDGASSSWGIARVRGRWVVTGSSGYGTGAARGYYYGYTVPLAVPARVAGFDETPVPWELVLEEFPDATDVYASPAKDVVVVRQQGSLFVCARVERGGPGRRLATLVVPDPAATVMVQWALGAGVGKWTRALGPLLAAGPPEVRLDFDPPAAPPKTEKKP